MAKDRELYTVEKANYLLFFIVSLTLEVGAFATLQRRSDKWDIAFIMVLV